jgi:hypothetical protein
VGLDVLGSSELSAVGAVVISSAASWSRSEAETARVDGNASSTLSVTAMSAVGGVGNEASAATSTIRFISDTSGL